MIVSRRRRRAGQWKELRLPTPDIRPVDAQAQRPPLPPASATAPAPVPALVQEAALSQARRPFSRRALVAHLAIRSAAASATALALLGALTPKEAIASAAPAQAAPQASAAVNDGA